MFACLGTMVAVFKCTVTAGKKIFHLLPVGLTWKVTAQFVSLFILSLLALINASSVGSVYEMLQWSSCFWKWIASKKAMSHYHVCQNDGQQESLMQQKNICSHLRSYYWGVTVDMRFSWSTVNVCKLKKNKMLWSRCEMPLRLTTSPPHGKKKKITLLFTLRR